MALKRPPQDPLQDVALSLGIHLSEAQASSYNALLQPNFDAYDAVDAMPDYLPVVSYARTPGYRPLGEENKYGAWYVKTTIKGHLKDADGNVTVEAEGLFILPRWARESGGWPNRPPTFE